MIEVYLLEQLDAFARCGTLSRAAEELHITQPALSRSMKKIEAELGVPLFNRDKAKISFNETGRLAAQLAQRVLDEDRDLVMRVKAFDRSLRSISFGACASWPILGTSRLMHIHFPDMNISSEVRASDEELIAGLRDRTYQLVALHETPEARDLFCQYLDQETMTLSVKRSHRLAGREAVTFADLAGESILAWGNFSFWNDMLKRNLPDTNLLFQNDFDALDELIEKTDFPNFGSDRMAVAGYGQDTRVDIPVDEPEAHAAYYIACLDAEKERYGSLFNAVRAQALTRK
jgi:DNA-binding transcriptional LysR family regulator